MHSHPNARLNQRGRLRLICQHLDQGRSLSELAADAGISLRCAYKWPARFRRVGHQITGDRQEGRSYGVGFDKLHMAVDDATRLAYVEVLADEQKPTVIGFLSRAVTWFNGQGVECRRVMSDNGPAYVSKAFAKAC